MEKDEYHDNKQDIEIQSVESSDTDNNSEILVNKLQNQIMDLEEKLLRSLAEAENIRKRYEKKIEEERDYAIAKFSKDLLIIMDNLALALAHRDGENVIAGVELTKKELTGLFEKYNIVEILPQPGEKFDYNFHNAISETESTDYPQGSVLSILQAGYKLKDRLLRPAFVNVVK